MKSRDAVCSLIAAGLIGAIAAVGSAMFLTVEASGPVSAVSVAATAPSMQAAALSSLEPVPEAPEASTAPETVAVIRIPDITPDPAAVDLIGRTIWGEAGGVADPAERAAVAWCILNRVDAWELSIRSVVTEPNQFLGYRPEGVCPAEHLELAADVLTRWAWEQAGVPAEIVGRVLPEEYLYFWGDGRTNHFRTCRSGAYWDFSNPSPYGDDDE